VCRAVVVYPVWCIRMPSHPGLRAEISSQMDRLIQQPDCADGSA